MKRVFVLLTVALLSMMGISVQAKVVRGYVTDREGKPVEGVKMVVFNQENPAHRSLAATDTEGFFSVTVPDNTDPSDIVDVLSLNGTRVIRYREMGGMVQITIESSKGKTTSKRQKTLR